MYQNKRPIYMNFKRENKWLGIIDYKSLLCILVYVVVVIKLLSCINITFDIKIYIFSVLCMPIIAMFCVNTRNESFVDMLVIVIRFIINRKYFVKKDEMIHFSNDMYKK